MSKRAVKPRINLPLSSSSTAVASASGGGAAAPSPTTVSMATGNTVVGGLHTHELDIAAHTGDDSAHHSPVTVTNAGLALAGQALGLSLAATSGLQIDAGLKLADSIAGNGLTISGKVLAVGAGAGLTVSADAIALTKPGTLAHNSLNAAAGNHTHAITSSSNPGAAASILASSASGYLQLRRIGLGTAPSYPLHVSAATQQARFDYNTSNYLSVTVGSDGSTLLSTATSASGGNLTLAPVGDVVLDPTNRYILPGSGYSEHLGSMQRKYLTLHAAELWVETLVAHETMATIGGRILVGPTTELIADISDTAATFLVKHNELDYLDTVRLEAHGKVEFIQINQWFITFASSIGNYFRVASDLTGLFPTGAYFTVKGSTANDGQYQVASASYDGGGDYTNIYVTTSVPSGVADGGIVYIGKQGGESFRYRILRDLDTSGANEWYAGDAVFNTGTTGDGFIDLYSVHGVKSTSEYGPSIVGNVRNSTTYNDWSEHWAIGNLNGVYGYGATAYGAAFGKYANGYSFLTVDATNGVRMLRRASGTDTTLAQWAVDGVLTIGEVAAERSNIQISAGALALRLNTTPLIAADTSGNLALGQVATDQGNAYWNASNKRLEFRGGTDGTAVNAYIDTDGAFVAADGNLAMYDDSFRVSIDNNAFVSNRYSFRWQSFAGAEVGFIAGRSFDGSNNQISIAAKGVSGGSWGTIALRARLSTEDLQTDSDGATFLVQPKNIFIYNQGLIVAADATNIADTVAAGDAMIEGGLNIGTATGAAAGDIRYSGALRTGSQAIDDDSAYSFTPSTTRGLIAVWDYSLGKIAALVAYRVGAAGSSMTLMADTLSIAVTTGALGGTTGADGSVTVSAHTDGKIYIENRMGGTRTFRWTIMG